MKLFFKLLLSMRLSVMNNNSDIQELKIDGYQSAKSILLADLDLYHKIDFEYRQDISNYVLNNWKNILKEGLAEFDDNYEFFIETDLNFVHYENFRLTISFNEESPIVDNQKSIKKSFDLFFYNYDNINKIIEEVESKFILPSFVQNYNQKQLYYYLEATLKTEFDDICQKNIILNNEQEFFDYVSIKFIRKDKIVFSFLNNTEFCLKIALT